MRNVLGPILILGGTWLLWSGWTRRSRGLATPGQGPAATNPSLSDFGAIVRPLIYTALGYFALKASLAYAVLDVGRIVSPFDFAGFLFFLAAYAGWLHLRTASPPANAPVARDLTAETTSEELVRGGLNCDRSRIALPFVRDRAGAGGRTVPPAPASEAARSGSRAAWRAGASRSATS